MEQKNYGAQISSLVFAVLYAAANYEKIFTHLDNQDFFKISTFYDFTDKMSLLLILPVFILLCVISQKTYDIYAGILFVFDLMLLSNFLNSIILRYEHESFLWLLVIQLGVMLIANVCLLLMAYGKMKMTPVAIAVFLGVVPSVLLMFGYAREFDRTLDWQMNVLCCIGLMSGFIGLSGIWEEPADYGIPEQPQPLQMETADVEDVAGSSGEVPRFTYRSVASCLFLCLITCGIYGIYWTAVMIREVRQFHGDYSPATKEVLLYLFVPFYNWYWGYTRGRQLYYDSYRINGNLPDRSGMYLLFSILGWYAIVFAVMQSDMNSFIVRWNER